MRCCSCMCPGCRWLSRPANRPPALFTTLADPSTPLCSPPRRRVAARGAARRPSSRSSPRSRRRSRLQSRSQQPVPTSRQPSPQSAAGATASSRRSRRPKRSSQVGRGASVGQGCSLRVQHVSAAKAQMQHICPTRFPLLRAEAEEAAEEPAKPAPRASARGRGKKQAAAAEEPAAEEPAAGGQGWHAVPGLPPVVCSL